MSDAKHIESSAKTALFGFDRQQIFVFQSLQRGPYRGATHLKIVRQLRFSHPSSRRQIESNNHLTQSFINCLRGEFLLHRAVSVVGEEAKF